MYYYIQHVEPNYILFLVDSNFYSSEYVKHQIEDLGLLVKLAFVGDNFARTVQYLETESETIKQGNKSYLLFHYAPSLVTHTYKLTTVKFDQCPQQWSQMTSSSSNYSVPSNLQCLYSSNKFSKVR